MMQLYQRTGQMQTDTCTEIGFRYIIIYLIKAFENAFYLIPVDTDTAIRYHNLKIVTQRIPACYIPAC